MYNLLIAGVAGLGVMLLFVALGFTWGASSLPALFVFPVLYFVLNRRTSAQVSEALMPLQAMVAGLQGVKTVEERDRKVDEMKALLRQVRQDFAGWQLMIESQMDGQLGMLDYARGQFDDALPLLAASSTWDWTSQAALACLYYRRDRLEDAWKAFGVAASAAPKEPTHYAVHAVLRARKGQREEALKVLREGLVAVEGSEVLKTLRDAIANKQAPDTAVIGQHWYSLFPEELAQQQQQQAFVRGMRGPPPEGVKLQPIMGPPQPKSRGKLARRR